MCFFPFFACKSFHLDVVSVFFVLIPPINDPDQLEGRKNSYANIFFLLNIKIIDAHAWNTAHVLIDCNIISYKFSISNDVRIKSRISKWKRIRTMRARVFVPNNHFLFACVCFEEN